MQLEVKKMRPEAIIPKYQRPGDAGFDLHAVVDSEISIPPKSQCVIPTGLAISIPNGWELQIRPRSGLAFKKSITITNSPGTIDSGFLDEIMIILYNLGEENFIVKNGDRIAQAVLNQIEQAEFDIVDEFANKKNDRGGGFGSTGI